jgi:hypothetical protein
MVQTIRVKVVSCERHRINCGGRRVASCCGVNAGVRWQQFLVTLPVKLDARKPDTTMRDMCDDETQWWGAITELRYTR